MSHDLIMQSENMPLWRVWVPADEAISMVATPQDCKAAFSLSICNAVIAD